MKTGLTVNASMKTANERLAAWVKRACGHIRRPKNLQEIVDDLEGNEYNAEQTVQHMAMLLCTQVERNNEDKQNKQ